jgi:hypothetical protein
VARAISGFTGSDLPAAGFKSPTLPHPASARSAMVAIFEALRMARD